MNKNALILGWVAGIVSGVGLAYLANTKNGVFTQFSTSLFNMGQPFGLLYIALISLVINFIFVIVFTFVFKAMGQEGPAKSVGGD